MPEGGASRCPRWALAFSLRHDLRVSGTHVPLRNGVARLAVASQSPEGVRVSALTAVAVPRSERDPVRRQISSYYARSGDVATGIDNVISAVASSNPLAVRRGLATLRGGLISSLAMSKGFRRYGATVCADYFLVPSQEIDGLAPPPAPPQPVNSYLRPAALTTAANGSAPSAPGLVATHPQG